MVVADTVAAAKGKKRQYNDDDFCCDSQIESQALSGFEQVKPEIKCHEERVGCKDGCDDYVALKFHGWCYFFYLWIRVLPRGCCWDMPLACWPLLFFRLP